VSAFGAIKEGTELEDYDTKHSLFRAFRYTSAAAIGGTMIVGGIGYAAYLKYFKPKPSKKRLTNEKFKKMTRQDQTI
jgi:hypothetical protein